MPDYYIQIVNDEVPTRYVERGVGFGGVKITDSLQNAKRYSTREEAEKVAALARKQKDREPGGEMSAIEIIEENQGSDGWEIRARFELPASGAESRFEMKLSQSGIFSRYIGFDGLASPEYRPEEMRDAVSDWTNSVSAWFAAKIGRRDGK